MYFFRVEKLLTSSISPLKPKQIIKVKPMTPEFIKLQETAAESTSNFTSCPLTTTTIQTHNQLNESCLENADYLWIANRKNYNIQHFLNDNNNNNEYENNQKVSHSTHENNNIRENIYNVSNPTHDKNVDNNPHNIYDIYEISDAEPGISYRNFQSRKRSLIDDDTNPNTSRKKRFVKTTKKIKKECEEDTKVFKRKSNEQQVGHTSKKPCLYNTRTNKRTVYSEDMQIDSIQPTVSNVRVSSTSGDDSNLHISTKKLCFKKQTGVTSTDTKNLNINNENDTQNNNKNSLYSTDHLPLDAVVTSNEILPLHNSLHISNENDIEALRESNQQSATEEIMPLFKWKNMNLNSSKQADKESIVLNENESNNDDNFAVLENECILFQSHSDPNSESGLSDDILFNERLFTIENVATSTKFQSATNKQNVNKNTQNNNSTKSKLVSTRSIVRSQCTTRISQDFISENFNALHYKEIELITEEAILSGDSNSSSIIPASSYTGEYEFILFVS